MPPDNANTLIRGKAVPMIRNVLPTVEVIYASKKAPPLRRRIMKNKPQAKGNTMSPGDLKSFGKKYAEAWSSHNPDNVLALHSETSRLSVNDGEPAIGKQAIRKIVQGFIESYPDLHIQVNDVVEKQNKIIFYCNVIATNSGPGGTGNKINMEVQEFWTFDENCKFIEINAYDDQEKFARHLGNRAS